MVDRAPVLAQRLHVALGTKRNPGEPTPDDPQRVRARAFTLFARAYAEVRRGVAFVRFHHGDADAYAPSIYVKQRRRGAGGIEAGTEVVGEEIAEVVPADEADAVVDLTDDVAAVG